MNNTTVTGTKTYCLQCGRFDCTCNTTNVKMYTPEVKMQEWYVAKANEMMGFYVALKTEMTALKQLVDALEKKVSRMEIGIKNDTKVSNKC